MALKNVTVYSKPACVQCTATKRWLDQNGYKDAYSDGDAIENMDVIKDFLGLLAAPVIKVVDPATSEIIYWSGHNPILLEKHLKLV